MIITKGTINDNAWVNNTWLAPYFKYPVTLRKFITGRIDLLLDGEWYERVDGEYLTSNGY